MTVILIEFAIVLIGLVLSKVLFYHFPTLPGVKREPENFPSVSVIIPARNEEMNLPLLLKDLNAQTLPAYEIFCVDDASDDATAQIAVSYGAKLISIDNKPEGWTGKTWACQKGADAAKGDLLLFLDADVRLGQDGLRRVTQAYMEFGCTVSVQPFHKTQKVYEQFSMMFNLVQIAANGTALPNPLHIGLYGPVILISQSDYTKVGGHEIAKNSVVEDMTLGLELKKAGIPYQLFVGNEDVAFRMYGDGFKSLLEGWIKNVASGSTKMPLPLFLMVFTWIASIISVPLQLIKFAFSTNILWLLLYSLLYIVWVSILAILIKRVGNFHRWALLFYPILILLFIGVYMVSMIKKIFGLKVTWKGRAIETGKKRCE